MWKIKCGGDTQSLLTIFKEIRTFCTLRQQGCAHVQWVTWWNFHYLIFSIRSCTKMSMFLSRFFLGRGKRLVIVTCVWSHHARMRVSLRRYVTTRGRRREWTSTHRPVCLENQRVMGHLLLRVHLYWGESDIASRWVHRESNLMFTFSSGKYVMLRNFEDLSHQSAKRFTPRNCSLVRFKAYLR